jgi:hypothetical protein
MMLSFKEARQRLFEHIVNRRVDANRHGIELSGSDVREVQFNREDGCDRECLVDVVFSDDSELQLTVHHDAPVRDLSHDELMALFTGCPQS